MPNLCAPALAAGFFRMECRDASGKLRWRMPPLANGVTFQGANRALDRMFGGLGSLSWYGLLISNSGFIEVLNTDEMASHAGWGEFVGVSGTVRKQFTFGSAGAGQIASVGSISYLVTSAGSIKGIAAVSSQTLGSTSGILYSTAIATTPLTVAPTNTIFASYIIRFA